MPEPAVDRPESRNRQIVQPAWEQCVAEAVATRLGRDLDVEPTPRTVAGAAIGALNAALAIWVAGGCSELLPDLTARAFQVLERLVWPGKAGRDWETRR